MSELSLRVHLLWLAPVPATIRAIGRAARTQIQVPVVDYSANTCVKSSNDDFKGLLWSKNQGSQRLMIGQVWIMISGVSGTARYRLRARRVGLPPWCKAAFSTFSNLMSVQLRGLEAARYCRCACRVDVLPLSGLQLPIL